MIACEYCMEDSIPLFFERLVEQKSEFSTVLESVRNLSFIWRIILKGTCASLSYPTRSFNQYAFHESVEAYNRYAVEYFYLKLTHEEREASLMSTVLSLLACEIRYDDKEGFCNVLCYLLSILTPEQQLEAIKANPVRVFSCFHFWPLSDLFLENSRLLWPLLPPDSYNDLLEWGLCRMRKTCFPNHFQEILEQSPLDFRKSFVSGPYPPALIYLKAFFLDENVESLEAIFRNVDAADRVGLVFNPEFLRLMFYSILENRWPMVEVCLREAGLSVEDKKRLKNLTFDNFGEPPDYSKFQMFYDFLNESDERDDTEKKGQKRKLEKC